MPIDPPKQDHPSYSLLDGFVAAQPHAARQAYRAALNDLAHATNEPMPVVWAPDYGARARLGFVLAGNKKRQRLGESEAKLLPQTTDLVAELHRLEDEMVKEFRRAGTAGEFTATGVRGAGRRRPLSQGLFKNAIRLDVAENRLTAADGRSYEDVQILIVATASLHGAALRTEFFRWAGQEYPGTLPPAERLLSQARENVSAHVNREMVREFRQSVPPEFRRPGRPRSADL